MLIVLVGGACAGGGGKPPRAAAGGGKPALLDQPPAEGERYDDGGYFVAADPALTTALARAIAGDGWEGLHILSECQEESGRSSQVLIWGNGVGLWNRERQFTLDRSQITRILQAFETYEFPRLRDVYGGKSDPTPHPPGQEGGAAALRVVCRISLELGGVRKAANQLDIGRFSRELVALSRSVLDICRQPAETGVTAESLDDGLAKIARGQLAPEALSILLHKKPDRRTGGGREGFLLRIDGRRATNRAFGQVEGYGEERRLELGDGDLAAIAERLRASHVDELPANLYATDYTDFTVIVLNRERRVQARQFSGMTPNTHGDYQEDFIALAATLTELGQRVLAEGEVVPEEK